MEKDQIQVSFIGMEPTDALKKYFLEKLFKKENLLEEVTGIEVYLKQQKNSKGIKDDFRIDIDMHLPKADVRVEEIGEDMYANIDKATDVIFRKLKIYYDQKAHWEGNESWKVLEAEAELSQFEGEDIDDYSDYIPKIVKRKTVEDMSPLEEGEAIERMELMGYDQYLFRSKKTNKISMIYKRKDGNYGLVEPSDGVM